MLLKLGIDATNIRGGGGVTHLIELLRAAEPEKYGIAKVVVWAGQKTLDALDERPWLEKINPPELDSGLLKRTFWQRFKLSKAAKSSGCDVLFVPGGSYSGSYRPFVTMSQNMLPFEWQELRRYGLSTLTVKLFLLRFSQTHSLRQADGVIFLTNYAKQAVQKVTGELKGEVTNIPHGLNSRFFLTPKFQRPIDNFSKQSPYRVLYVSIVDQYKHQWHLVEAMANLRRQTNWPLTLDLVGPAYAPALNRLQAFMEKFDSQSNWIRYHGPVNYSDLHGMYSQADLGVFASSCENMPNILLETMAAGLPVVCSNRGPMPEILKENGVYFDPEKPEEIACALERLIASPALREEKVAASYKAASAYSWQRCASDTFGFLAKVTEKYQDKSCAE